MTLVHRVLPPQPLLTLDAYRKARGGEGLEAARQVEPEALIDEVEASGLRGRGGGGFPTGTKWRTVAADRPSNAQCTVVVNGAEGEPGTFKDRTILRTNPFAVIEGALIAARAVTADQIIIGIKKSFATEARNLLGAIEEVKAAGWADGIEIKLFEGPNEYLYGEETALLETMDGRYPFPRITPPFRRGVREVVESPADARSESGLSAHVEMAGPGGAFAAAPTLANNVETMANIPHIISRGAKWFRTEGTEQSPGTIVCTISGMTQRSGVGEVIMGTPLREAIEEIGGGVRAGHHVKAVMSGVANVLLTGDQLDAPLSYEGMQAAGSGLGSAGFIVYDDTIDLTRVAAGVARFLAVESCGQCTPCKLDGMAISDLLERFCASDVGERELARLRDLLSTVADEARCNLATQQQVVIGSILDKFGDDMVGHTRGGPAVRPDIVAEMLDIRGDEALVDERHAQKQPDWTYDAEWSGQVPAERYDDHRHHEVLPE